MNAFDAQQQMLQLMEQHGLPQQGWRFSFDRSVRRFGCCHHAQKLLTLSLKLVRLNDEAKVRDTMLHEIAHALVGAGHGHNSTWRRQAIAIGCNGQRCYSYADTATVPRKWKGTCSHCGRTIERHTRKRGLYHTRCGPERGKFVFTRAL